ncbi:MAG: hypothetical protein HY047_03685 [Acidobacteria bacterium]|nr:hypothetical protein [Acidobacteriota bacterium]
MRPALLVVSATFAITAAISCGASVTSPTQANDLSGMWRGTGVDSQGATIVTWALTQTGANVSGAVKTQAVDPNDGSCSSCHRNKSGTFSGSIDGTTLMLTMHFAAGADGDPTPACTATLSGTASTAVANQLAAVYSGADSCEGPFLNGSLPMTRQR